MSDTPSEIIFPAPLFERIRQTLLFGNDSRESAAIVIAQPLAPGRGCHRLLARTAVFPRADEYLHRDAFGVQLSPAFVARAVKQARNENGSVILVHSHPFDTGSPTFSSVDDRGEAQLRGMIDRRLPGRPHAAMVVSPGGIVARGLGSELLNEVIVIGATRERIASRDPEYFDVKRFDRQVRAFGVQGQRVLSSLTVGVIGLGGTGSIVADQLAHLGVGRFILVDMDRVEASNLNRLVGATAKDIGRLKTELAAQSIRAQRPDAVVEIIAESVNTIDVATRLIPSSFLFACTDTHGSRAVVNQLAYQYLVPCIDLGVSIDSRNGSISRITGRVQLLAPGLGCLVCGRVLDPELVREDLLTEAERRADPYITGEHVPQPAVMSLNGTIASLAVTMFLGASIGIPAAARLQIYNGLAGTIRAATAKPDPDCYVCGVDGATARGASWPLFGRHRTDERIAE